MIHDNPSLINGIRKLEELDMRKLTPLVTAGGLAVALACAATPSLGQSNNVTYLGENATYCEIFRALNNIIPGECADASERPKTRGIVRLDGGAAENSKPVRQKNPPKELALALRVEFEFDSADLTPQAQEILTKVAEVLKSDIMKDKAFQVTGHADARGSEDYNLALSQRRARAVTKFLSDEHQIRFTRLRSTGLGESQPFDAENPNAAVNRRVEFLNLSE